MIILIHVSKRDKREGKETLERINLRLSKLKKEGVDTSHFETLCENILKTIRLNFRVKEGWDANG